MKKTDHQCYVLYHPGNSFDHVDLNVLLRQKESNQLPYVLWRQKPAQNEKLLEAKQCDNYS